jgi:hypothetical protein
MVNHSDSSVWPVRSGIDAEDGQGSGQAFWSLALKQVHLDRGHTMEQGHVPRRSFLATAAGVAFFLVVPGCRSGRRIGEYDTRALRQMARLLYPHDALSDDIYAAVLQPLQSRAADDPALSAALQAGLEELDRLAGRDWRSAPPEEQVRALQQIAKAPFFATVQEAVRAQLYQHPEVWKVIGYEGPSAPLGGYLHRGFADIDWLPGD